MSDNEPIKPKPIHQPIVIDQVHEEKGKSGKDLKHCFFLPTEIEGFYNFFDSHGRTLATGVSSDKPFPFLLDGHAWTIQMGPIDDFFAKGGWTNTAPTPLNPPYEDQGPGYDDEQDGSFQASSGPGGDPTENEGDNVPVTPPPGAVIINNVLGTSDSNKLKGMYFTKDPGPNDNWNLYNKHGKWIESGIQSGMGFNFPHDSFTPPNSNTQKIIWTVTEFVINAQAASGKWINTDPGPTGEQGGSFQASSGPGADPETASAASAS